MKKKIISLIAIIAMFIPMIAKADMGAPGFKTYFVGLKNDTAQIYDIFGKETDESLLDRTSYIVLGEEFIDGELYLIVEDVNISEDDYSYGKYVKADDVILENDIVSPSADDLKYSHTYKVLENNQIKLYKGPSLAYGQATDYLPKGTILKTTYQAISFSEGGNDDYAPWYYTEYNGTKGWVKSDIHDRAWINTDYQGLSTISKEKKKLLIIEPTKMYEDILNDEKVITTIPKNIELEYTEYTDDTNGCDGYAKVTYNNITGWVNNAIFCGAGDYILNLASSSDEEFLTYKDTKLYDYETFELTDLSLKSNKEYKIDYHYFTYKNDKENYKNYLLINYNDNKYWVDEKDIAEETDNNYIYKSLKDNVKLYDKYTLSGKAIGTINKNDNISKVYYTSDDNSHKYYVVTSGLSGWVSNDSIFEIFINEHRPKIKNYITLEMYEQPYLDSKKMGYSIKKYNVICYDQSAYYEIDNVDYRWYKITVNGKTGWVYGNSDSDIKSTNDSLTVFDINEDNKNDKANDWYKNLTPKTIIILSVSGALILSITAVLIIIIINKKKKSRIIEK